MQISGAIAPVQYTDGSGNPVAVTSVDPLPTSGGGGGSLLADVLLTDDTGALFVGRDDGTAVTYFNLNTNAVYTPSGTIQDAGSEPQQNMILLLTRMLNYLNSPMGYDKSLQRQRSTVVVESGTVTTVTTVTTVGTVTTLSNIDGYNARMQILDQNRVAWAQCVRARIT